MGKTINVQLVKGNGYPLRAVKILPNSPCFCQSGLKFKKCHGKGTDGTRYFFSKLTESQKAEIEKKAELEKANAEKVNTHELAEAESK
jgi:hypothetical protein